MVRRTEMAIAPEGFETNLDFSSAFQKYQSLLGPSSETCDIAFLASVVMSIGIILSYIFPSIIGAEFGVVE